MAKNEIVNPVTPEENLDATDRVGRWFMSHIRLILIVLTIALLAAVAYILYGMYRDKKSAEADKALAGATAYFEAGQYDLALNGDEDGVAGLEAIAEDYDGYKQGEIATALAGLSYLEQGDAEQGAELLAKVDLADGLIDPALKLRLADAYLSLNRVGEAIDAYNHAIDAASEAISPIAAKKLGILYLSQGNKNAAREAFLVIKNGYPKSMEASDIDMYIGYAQ